MIPVLADDAKMRAALSFPSLIAALRRAFAMGAEVPPRHHHPMPQPDGTTATLLVMPAWQDGGYLGIKIVGVYPGNAARGLPGLQSTYLLNEAATGLPLALLDGNEITRRRTAAASALGADYLAHPDASSLLVVGSGQVASLLPEAFASVRPIERIEIWSRNPAKAEELVARLREDGREATAVTDLAEAVRRADIVSCATLSTAPLIRGAWLKPGTHLDLIGSFTPAMREADDAAMAAGSIFVDTAAAFEEAGDLVGPIRAGLISPDAGSATLGDLCRGKAVGRQSPDAITIFKAVGTGLADLAAATLAYSKLAQVRISQ